MHQSTLDPQSLEYLNAIYRCLTSGYAAFVTPFLEMLPPHLQHSVDKPEEKLLSLVLLIAVLLDTGHVEVSSEHRSQKLCESLLFLYLWPHLALLFCYLVNQASDNIHPSYNGRMHNWWHYDMCRTPKKGNHSFWEFKRIFLANMTCFGWCNIIQRCHAEMHVTLRCSAERLHP